jgi:methyl-accepting chemotaxis protein
VSESGQTLERIVGSVKKVSDIIAELAAGSREQLSGIEMVNRAVTQLDQMTQQNAALVEEASAASKSMAGRSQAMSGMLERYQLGNGEQYRADEGGTSSRGGVRRVA